MPIPMWHRTPTCLYSEWPEVGAVACRRSTGHRNSGVEMEIEKFFLSFERAQIPSLLSAMSVANTISTYAFSNALSRLSTIRYRGVAKFAVGMSWLSLALVTSCYVFDWDALGKNWGVPSLPKVPFLAGISLWVLSFFLAFFVVAGMGMTSIYSRMLGRRFNNLVFPDNRNNADFGVSAIDRIIGLAARSRSGVHYPFFLCHDRDSPGLEIAKRFVRQSIKSNDAIIYVSFSRPATIPWKQLHEFCQIPEGSSGNFYVLDCYSRAYMPEGVGGLKSKNIFFADPRNPHDVYAKYAKILSNISKSKPAPSGCRVIYESLSDFIRVTDPELVVHFLRRTVVLEEIQNVRSLYLYWSGVNTPNIDEEYLSWFFNVTLKLTRSAESENGHYQLKVERMFANHVTVPLNETFDWDTSRMFKKSPSRALELGKSAIALEYKPKPYGFLKELGKNKVERLTAFLFFMIAIDHNTHSEISRYEGEVDGKFLHGSDLLFRMAEKAAYNDSNLFTIDRMKNFTEEDADTIFRTNDGKLPTDLKGRVEIFRTLAKDAKNIAKGSISEWIGKNLAESSGKVDYDRFIESISQFRAFNDPFSKKANLLCKVLLREDIISIKDPQKLEIPIDHVVMTMMLRSGAVKCHDETLLKRLKSGKILDEATVTTLRDATRDVTKFIVAETGILPMYLDDLIWSYGRQSLRKGVPLPDTNVSSELDGQLRRERLSDFISRLNGCKEGGEPMIPTIRVPFTRYF